MPKTTKRTSQKKNNKNHSKKKSNKNKKRNKRSEDCKYSDDESSENMVLEDKK